MVHSLPNFNGWFGYFMIKPNFERKQIEFIKFYDGDTVLWAKYYDILVYNLNKKTLYFSKDMEMDYESEHPDTAGFCYYRMFRLTPVGNISHIFKTTKKKKVLFHNHDTLPQTIRGMIQLMHWHLN